MIDYVIILALLLLLIVLSLPTMLQLTCYFLNDSSMFTSHTARPDLIRADSPPKQSNPPVQRLAPIQNFNSNLRLSSFSSHAFLSVFFLHSDSRVSDDLLMKPTFSDSPVSSFQLAFAALALMTALPSAAQSGENGHAPTFTIDAPVVLVPTTVVDRHGSIVTGLPADAFAVSQDNVPERITSFSEQDIPVSIGVVFDTSGSMRSVLPEAKDTLRAFLGACNPEDEALMYTVANRPEQDFGFTQDFNSLLGHLVFTDAGGSTALVDTIYAALLQTRRAHNGRKALLVISDGMDNHSRYTVHELTAAAVEADVQIYAVTVFDPPRNKKPIELAEERNGVFFLEELSRKTGGFQMTAFGAGDVNQAAVKVGRAMRDQYLIGYVPASSSDNGKWHAIKVNLKAGNGTAYTRSGFYSK